MLWKFMIFKEEKNNKRDIQRPGFQGAKKSRVLPKKLRFLNITMFSCEICEFFQNSFFYRTPPVAASDNALCEEINASCCHSLCCFSPTSE